MIQYFRVGFVFRLMRMDKPDLAMALTVMDGYCIGHTCLCVGRAKRALK